MSPTSTNSQRATMKRDIPPYSLKIVKQPPLHVFSDEWFDVGIILAHLHPFKSSKSLPSHSKQIKISAELHYDNEGPPAFDKSESPVPLVLTHSDSFSNTTNTSSTITNSNSTSISTTNRTTSHKVPHAHCFLKMEPKTIALEKYNQSNTKDKCVVVRCKLQTLDPKARPNRFCIRFHQSHQIHDTNTESYTSTGTSTNPSTNTSIESFTRSGSSSILPTQAQAQAQAQAQHEVKPERESQIQSSKTDIRTRPLLTHFHADTLPTDVASVTTKTIHIVDYKLLIQNTQTWNKVWYKDEGGRDKCMQATLQLIGKGNRVVLGKKIRLFLKLTYENESKAQIVNQDILRTFGPPQQCVDPQTGEAKLQFRIDDVSRNHQGFQFVVEIHADPASGYIVAPDRTQPVSVRSKRNKRQRPSTFTNITQSSTEAMPHQQISSTQRRTIHTFHESPIIMNQEPNSTIQPLLHDTSETEILHKAMRGILRWTYEVINSLVPLKWQLIGYDRLDDGATNFNSPHYSMKNPNETISQIISMYNNETKDNLRCISNAIEANRTFSERDSSAASATNHPTTPTPSYLLQDINPSLFAEDKSPTHSQQTHVHPFDDIFFDKSHHTSRQHEMKQHDKWPHFQSSVSTSLTGPQNQQLHQQQHSKTSTLHSPPTNMNISGDPSVHEQHRNIEILQNTQAEEDLEGENAQANVQYVLAREFILKTHERLGFPAYSTTKDILGFYKESDINAGNRRFIPFQSCLNRIGQDEMTQAKTLLENAIAKGSLAVYQRKDWDSLTNMVDNASDDDWTKNILWTSSNPNPRTMKDI